MLLSDIIREMESKRIPSSIEDKAQWIQELSSQSKRVAPITACLISSARRDNFNDDAAAWLNWGEKTFSFNRKYISHCYNIGTLLMSVKGEAYKKLSPLDMGKLLALSRLPVDKAEAYAEAKDVATLNRDQVRADVAEILGEKPKAQEKETPPEEPDKTARIFELASELSEAQIPELQEAVKRAGRAEAEAMLKTGQKLFSAGMEAAISNKLLGEVQLAQFERYLSMQLNETRQRIAALKAPAIPQIEAKTA